MKLNFRYPSFYVFDFKKKAGNYSLDSGIS